MADAQSQAAILEELLPTITKIRYAELASTAIILFDHVLTLDREIELFWHAQWSLGKLLFLINRYYALCTVVFNNYVLFNTNALSSSLYVALRYGSTGVFMFVIAELILQLRLYALYFRDKRILALTTFVSVGAAVGASYVMGNALSFITTYAIRLPLSNTTVCVPFGLPGDFYAFWVPMLVSESVLCGLAIYRGSYSYRPGANVMQSGKRIIEILVLDSVFYFVIHDRLVLEEGELADAEFVPTSIFATYLMNTIIFLTRPGAEVEIPVGFAVALSSVMSSRLCLNVRGHLHDPEADANPSRSLPKSPPLSPVLSPSSPNRGRIGSRRAFEPFSLDAAKDAERDQEMTVSVESSVGHGSVALSDVEMRELGIVRAPSTGHLRIVSVDRAQNSIA
ncbi:hypothetical protein LXA43DRAFT_1107223 [Ganoderma leucocontextum]|nr:hypothetical protein LXA43DRAFT_1107223 [Ganoderma leucocontextum]